MESNNITKNAQILVVDDDPINIRNAVRILKDDYKVVFATNGKAALELAKKSMPDLMLLDLHMPEMNGFEVLENIQADDELKEIPVIFLTADSDQETEVRGLKAGALDFIAKPFMDEIVKQRVSHLLELSILQKDLKSEVERQTFKAEERRRQMEEMSFQTVQALAGAIDAKDRYTKGHSSRVSDYSVMLARKAGWKKNELDNLRYAALLHDVGKIGVPDSVLNKPGKLSDVEFGVIKSHTTVGSDILRNITSVVDAVDVARHHHERYNGTGYPDKLKGEEISEMARIVCIADAYDAMNSKRIYRNALSADVIRNELEKGKGTQFDPKYLDIFLELFDAGELSKVEEMESESVETGATIIRRVFESVYDTAATNQVDALTGLPMRGYAEATIKEQMIEAQGVLIIIDLDNLKKLNDLYGHRSGDELLSKIGKMFASMDGISVACRLGGDEFLVYVRELNYADTRNLLDNIYKQFNEIKASNDSFEYNSLSCGVCFTMTTDVYEDVYSNADKALYFAKRNGKGNYHFFERDAVDNVVEKDVDLDALVKSFSASGDYNGALQVDYREFTQLFEYMKNMQRRYSHGIQLVMVTLEVLETGKPNIENIGRAVTAMEDAICSTIRTVDICTRYTSMQFLVILMGTKSQEIEIIMERIFTEFYKTYDDRKIVPSYEVAQIDMD